MKSVLSLFILILVVVGGLSAQTRIRMGQTLQGQLDTGSLKLDDGSYYDLYRYDSPGNETIVITLSSSDFDAFLMVGTLENNTFNNLGNDDDGGGGTDSRLEVTLSAAGAYYFRANTISADETGSYTIGLTSAGSAPARAASTGPSVKDLKIGETIAGQLNASNEVLEDGSYAQRYRVRLAQGQQVEIDEGDVVGNDDDSAGGTDARIEFTATKSADYIIVVNSVGEREEGDFALFVEHKGGPRSGGGSGAAPVANGRMISLGQRVSGTLGSSSLKASDDTYYDAYLIRGVPNTTVTFTLESDDFDAYLVIGLPGDDFESIESDDDGAGGTNSLLVYTFKDAQTYEIRANTLSEGEEGSYTLSVSSGSSSAPTAGPMRSISIDSRITGTLTEASQRLDDDSYYEDILLTGEANTMVSISLMSSDFDSYLNFGRLVNGEFESIQSNDDCSSESTASSCLLYTFADNGTYVIRANTLNEGETGEFTIYVIKKGTYTAKAANSLPALGMGRGVNGELKEGDPIPPGTSIPINDYKITVRRGETIELSLSSEDFDTVLTLLNDSYEQIDTNDDQESGGTDSKLVSTFSQAGTYVVRVSSLSANSLGAYTLEAKKK
jgi:hypothetical protein